MSSKYTPLSVLRNFLLFYYIIMQVILPNFDNVIKIRSHAISRVLKDVKSYTITNGQS